MAFDLTIVLDDRPGALADLGEAMGRAGVNLGGGCATVSGGEGTVHLLVEGDPADVEEALATAGLEVAAQRDVVVADVADRPGTLGSYARRLADAGVDIELFYVATGTRLVFGVNDVDEARAALA